MVNRLDSLKMFNVGFSLSTEAPVLRTKNAKEDPNKIDARLLVNIFIIQQTIDFLNHIGENIRLLAKRATEEYRHQQVRGIHRTVPIGKERRFTNLLLLHTLPFNSIGPFRA